MTTTGRTTFFRAAGTGLVLGALALFLAGCAAEKPAAPPAAKPAAPPAVQQPQAAPQAAPAAPAPEQPQAAQPAPPTGGEVTLKAVEAGKPVALEFKAVHFDYDKYTIRPEDRAAIAYDAAQLKQNPGVSVMIEGHCDERGTTEYNLALGEHRAVAVSKALQGDGIQESHLKTVSYGKERPVDPGHDEKAWAKNRRSVVRDTSAG